MGKILELTARARDIRRDIVEMAYVSGGPCHPGPALSCADIVAALYFDALRLRPEEPEWEGRDRFVLSKGHAAPVLYAALARRGFFPLSWYAGLRFAGHPLQGHPDSRKIPGVDISTGSLGNGLALGAGMAWALRQDKDDPQVYVLLGDGELQEGLVWEAALFCGGKALPNITAIVDVNGWQSSGAVEDILPLGSLADKWTSFGWRVDVIDGHDMEQIAQALAAARRQDGPTAILARTVKGKGVDFMENDNAWHQKKVSEEQYRSAIENLN